MCYEKMGFIRGEGVGRDIFSQSKDIFMEEVSNYAQITNETLVWEVFSIEKVAELFFKQKGDVDDVNTPSFERISTENASHQKKSKSFPWFEKFSAYSEQRNRFNVNSES